MGLLDAEVLWRLMSDPDPEHPQLLKSSHQSPALIGRSEEGGGHGAFLSRPEDSVTVLQSPVAG